MAHLLYSILGVFRQIGFWAVCWMLSFADISGAVPPVAVSQHFAALVHLAIGYDGVAPRTMACEANWKSCYWYDTVPALSEAETGNEAHGDELVFAEFAQFLAAGAGTGELLYGKYRVQSFEGRRIYTQDIDIGIPSKVDPNFVHPSVLARLNSGASNFDLMREGLAPIGADGRPMNLHHIIGEEPGPMVELEGSTHSLYRDPLHGLIEDGQSFRNIPGLESRYNQFRIRYWKWRADQLIY